MKQPKTIQISIPQPCTEDWHKMTPQQQCKFCDKCQKCVVDFTGFTDEQLYRFFAEHAGQQVCGRFSRTQINRTINLPHQPHSTLYKWIMAAGLALVLAAVPGPGAFAQAPYTQEQVVNNEDKATTYPGSVAGVVYNIGHKTAAGVQVTIFNDDVKYKDTTDEKGQYTFNNIPPGKYTIEAYVKNGNRGIVYNVPVEHNYLAIVIELSSGERGAAPMVQQYKPEPDPVIGLPAQVMGGTVIQTVEEDDLSRYPIRDIQDFVQLAGGLPVR